MWLTEVLEVEFPPYSLRPPPWGVPPNTSHTIFSRIYPNISHTIYPKHISYHFLASKAAGRVDEFTVPLKHLPGAGGVWSRFARGVDTSAAIREALESERAMFLPNSRPDSFRIVTDLGRPVGEQGETALRVIIGEDGKIWTAFPVHPW